MQTNDNVNISCTSLCKYDLWYLSLHMVILVLVLLNMFPSLLCFHWFIFSIFLSIFKHGFYASFTFIFELWPPTIVLTRFSKEDCKSSFMVLGKDVFVKRQLKVKREFLHKCFQLCPFVLEFLARNAKCSRMGNWHVGFSFGLLINGCL